MEQAKYDVFISYSRDDYFDGCGIVIPGNDVLKIKDALADAGITYWFDEEISSGHGISEEITTNIENSALFLFLSSANANKSDWIDKEIVYADKIKKYIIPVRIDATPYNNKIKFYIGSLKYVEYYTNPQKGLDDMIMDIKTYLDNMAKEKRHKEDEEQQKQLINDIRTSVFKLNEDEAKLDLERTNLYVKTEKVIDMEQQKSLKNEILESSPIRKKSQAEIKKLQGHVLELKTEKNSFVEKTDELFKELTDKKSENESLLKEIERLRQKLQSSTPKKNKWVHIVNWLMILVLISVICFFSCFYYDSGSITRPVSDIMTKQDSTVWDSIIVVRVRNVEFKMIKVEVGDFYMGAQPYHGYNYDSEAYTNERPVHNVTLNREYYMGETEVTQGLWMAVMRRETKRDGGWEKQYGEGRNYPVYRVSFNDIVNDFIPKLNRITGKNFCLPSEAEWEYAARGGNKSNGNGYKYSGSNFIYEVAVYKKNSNNNGAHKVKSKMMSNELGLYDMSGNVWEWCRNSYGDYTESSKIDPEGPLIDSDRVLRGGSWSSNAINFRVSRRISQDPDSVSNNIGFRLILYK